MPNTAQEYDKVIDICQDIFVKKMQDYGTAWRILRPTSITDQIYIKANRIRSIEEKGITKVGEGIIPEFIGIINRLRFAEEGIIAESIELTEKAILLKKRNNLQALESSQSMAELNAKLLMLEQLKSKGYLAPDVFESQSREINGQINEIKTKRIQSLSSALDVALNEFKTLQARLNEIDEPLDSFDPKLFEEVIKGMTVNNRDEMTFRLIGDLTFTVRL